LNFAVVANDNFIPYKYILSERYAFTDSGASTYMDPMPDPATIANFGALVNDGAWVYCDVMQLGQ
jgi:hypothetical protein